MADTLDKSAVFVLYRLLEIVAVAVITQLAIVAGHIPKATRAASEKGFSHVIRCDSLNQLVIHFHCKISFKSILFIFRLRRGGGFVFRLNNH